MSKLLITGEKGFLGSNFTNFFKDMNEIYHPATKIGLDGQWLENIPNDIDYILHFATVGGTRDYCIKNKEHVIESNAIITSEIMHAWKTVWPKAKFMGTLSSWAYPDELEILTERNIGLRYDTNNPYATAQRYFYDRFLEYKKNCNLNGTLYTLGNVFGEGDNYSGDKIHFIPMLIKHFVHEPYNLIKLNNDCCHFRTFMYVQDVILLMYLMRNVYSDVVQLGTGIDVYCIRDVVAQILIEKFNIPNGNLIYGSAKEKSRIVMGEETQYNHVLRNVPRTPLSTAISNTMRDYENSIFKQQQV